MKMLLTICASRHRPQLLNQMLDSFKETKSTLTDIVVYVSEDDYCLDEYKKVFATQKILHIVGPRKYLIDVDNEMVNRFPGYMYYSEINDDHVYHTDGWDLKLMQDIQMLGAGWGIAFGNDLLHKPAEINPLPSALVMSGNIIRTLGYFFYPKFHHTFADNYIRDLGLGIGRYFQNKEVIIEHRHVIAGKAPMDDNYKWVLSAEEMQYGKAVYNEWLKLHRENDIGRVKDAIKHAS